MSRITKLLLIFPIFLFTSTLHAKIIHVPADSSTIQGGINGASADDTVMVHPGTYYEHDIDFFGKAITVMSTDPEDSAVVASTFVDADSLGGVFILQSGEDTLSTLTGLTITGGLALLGGGIYCYGSSPTITNNTITANTATGHPGGGGMYNGSRNPTVTNCTFSENSSYYSGGGIYNWYSSPTVTNCTFSENSADNGGGGMFNWFSTPTMTNCTFSENSAVYRGGGMCNNFCQWLTIKNCTFSGNSATWGGGIFTNDQSFPTVTNCTFDGNSADNGGGMYNNSWSLPRVSNCKFSENSADFYGGGMFNWRSTPTVKNCTFSGNSADKGGGMVNSESSPRVLNCILWANTGGAIYDDDSTPIVTYSDVEGGYTGEGNIDTDPLFADPDYHLQLNSPCIDAGDPSILDACRPPGRGKERSDMGAYGGGGNCGWPIDNIELVIDPAGPVSVPKGDTLFFSTIIQNNTDSPVSGDYWLSVMLPSTYEVEIPESLLNYSNPLSGQVTGSGTLNLSNELYVPTEIPTGSYQLKGRVGIYSSIAIDEWWLDFEVLE
jgi:predicted outer membrane repeat protein